MGYYKDHAPISNTCPTIDSIISKLYSAKDEAEYIKKHPEEGNTTEAISIIGLLSDAISEMENIRSDNMDLRQWGNDEYERAYNLESEVDDYARKCEMLESEVDYLKLKIDELVEQYENKTI